MEIKKTARGFEVLEHPVYVSEPDSDVRVAQQSSAVGDYPDAMDRPGSSYLWLGRDHHLDRDEVRQLVRHLQAWLSTGSLDVRG